MIPAPTIASIALSYRELSSSTNRPDPAAAAAGLASGDQPRGEHEDEGSSGASCGIGGT